MPETTCCVPKCSRKGRDLFPSDISRRKMWVHAIKRGETKYGSWSPKTYSYICENHFIPDDYNSLTYAGKKIIAFET